MKIQGKQISNASISQSKFDILTDSIVSLSSVTNKEYVDTAIANKATLYYSKLNLNMPANATTGVDQKACDKTVIEFPLSNVLVKINGSLIDAGTTKDCYFSPDGTTKRVGGAAQKGDYLYWNSTKYNLDAEDEIDFVYLVGYYYAALSGGTTATLNSIYNTLVVKFTGGAGTTMDVIIDGVTIVVGNVLNNFVWDIGGIDEHTFTTANESIIVTINGNPYTIWWDGFGSLIFSAKKGGSIPVPPVDSSFKLEITTTSDNTEIILPHLDGYVYNYVVDYGDGTVLPVTSYNDVNCKHTYAVTGVYTLKISGTCETFYVGYSTLPIQDAITKILQWGDVNIVIPNFDGCSNLTSIASDSQGLSKVTTFEFAFEFTNITTIPSGLFNYCNSATNFSATFGSCYNLTTIPSGLFSGLTNVTSFSYTFIDCSLLTSIPSNLFNNSVTANFSGCFASCVGLLSVPNSLFENFINATSFIQIFNFCSSLVTVGNNVFKNCSNVQSISGAFDNCTSLTTIGYSLFENCSSANDFSGLFYMLPALTTVGDNLFKNCTSAIDMSSLFYGCPLTTIGSNMFTGCVNITSLSNTFSYANIVETPTGLFSGLTTVVNFSRVFSYCTKLEKLGDNTFESCISAIDLNEIFYQTSNVKTIGNNIFENCTSVTDFSLIFNNFSSLQTIGNGIFKNCSGALNFTGAFSNCVTLSAIGINIFNGCTSVTSFFQTFKNYSALSGYAPTLWSMYPTATGTDCFTGDNGLTNYADAVTAGWATE